MSASGVIARPGGGSMPAASPPASAGPAPLQGGALALTALTLAMVESSTCMKVPSASANVSLPTIAGNLGVSTDQGTWVITSFAVANGIGVPLTGWLMGRYGV